MKVTLLIAIVCAIVALGESFLPPKVGTCQTVKCKFGTTCVVKYGRARCVPAPPLCLPPLTIHQCKVAPCDVTKCLAHPRASCVNNYCGGCFADFYLSGRKVNCKIVKPNPCAFTTCPVGTRCVPVNDKLAKCVSALPPSCAAVLCFEGHKCVVRDGKATCEPTCKSSSDCKQQGSFCNTASGVCQCARFCPLRHTFPVCGSDGKQYGGMCQLNAAACEKKTTITTVLCKVDPCATVRCKAGTKCIVKSGKAICEPVDVCSLPAEPGLCKAYFPRYFHNKKSGKCERFIYGGCGGNKNNFATKKECEAQCPDVCSLPAEPGLCKAYFPRYFYNTKSGKCERFIYGGCGGNKNNFNTKKECEAQCHQGPCPPDKPLHYCIIPPCQTKKCPAFPFAKCVDNYCGGCHADFYVAGKKVDCKIRIKRDLPPAPCPLTIHQCKAAPCDVTKCPAHPTASCVNNYCGGCFADFYLNGRKVKCSTFGPKRELPSHPHFPSSCATVLCFIGHRCVERNGKARCEPLPACKSNDDCKQQGSYCTQSGVCECQRFCPLYHAPVCDPDGKQYSNDCFLNIAACEKGTTIPLVPCGVEKR